MFLNKTIKNLLIISLLISNIAIYPETQETKQKEDVAKLFAVGIVSTALLAYIAIVIARAPNAGKKQEEILKKFTNEEFDFHNLKNEARREGFAVNLIPILLTGNSDYPVQTLKNGAKINSYILFALGSIFSNDEYLKLSNKLYADICHLERDRDYVKYEEEYIKDCNEKLFRRLVLEKLSRI